MRTIKSALTLIIIVTLIISGCSDTVKDNNKEDNLNQIKETSKILDTHNIEITKVNNYEAEVTEFDFEEKEYLSKAGKIMPYSIKGIIGVPKGEGPFPLILISHGSHSNDDETRRFDTGFDYLVKDLAENGFIAVSMDMSKPYIWKYGDSDDNEKSIYVANDHIKNLIRVNEGENPGYKTDLKGKIDFEQVALIGHSRGGKAIFDIAKDQSKKGIRIKALLAIAPTFDFGSEGSNADVAVIVPEYDGDVIGLDGFKTYKSLNLNSKGFHSVTLLMKGNHNYFNRNIERNDAVMAKNEEELKSQLTRNEQEEFLMNFAVDFFNSSFYDKKDNFLTSKKPQPNKMYGFDVKNMYTSNDSVELLDIKSMDGFKGEGVKVEAKNDSWFYKYDEIIIDTITALIGEITDLDDPYMIKPLINIIWEEIDSKVVITPNTSDFSKFEGLTFNMVIDSANELNPKDRSQQFTLEMRDTSGNIAKVVLGENLNALGYTAGEIQYTALEDFNIYYWSNSSPISSINLPLSKFESVDLEHIESISIIFDKTNTGSIYIESIYLQ